MIGRARSSARPALSNEPALLVTPIVTSTLAGGARRMLDLSLYQRCYGLGVVFVVGLFRGRTGTLDSGLGLSGLLGVVVFLPHRMLVIQGIHADFFGQGCGNVSIDGDDLALFDHIGTEGRVHVAFCTNQLDLNLFGFAHVLLLLTVLKLIA